MTKLGVFLLGMTTAAAFAGDLSKYRNFQLGSGLPAIVKQTGLNLSQVKVIGRRPALIQELDWFPQPLGPSSKTEPVKEVAFSFCDGALFRITVDYDRYETEGLAPADFVETISARYGLAARPTGASKIVQAANGDEEQVIARWEDPLYRFDLTRSSYRPSFTLTAIEKKLDATAQAAILESKRLDDQEAPQRDAARAASEEEAAQAKLDKARLVNKPNFRP
jgi:hypothetical protein